MFLQLINYIFSVLYGLYLERLWPYVCQENNCVLMTLSTDTNNRKYNNHQKDH